MALLAAYANRAWDAGASTENVIGSPNLAPMQLGEADRLADEFGVNWQTQQHHNAQVLTGPLLQQPDCQWKEWLERPLPVGFEADRL